MKGDRPEPAPPPTSVPGWFSHSDKLPLLSGLSVPPSPLVGVQAKQK